MLRRYVYLDDASLRQYMATLEGGIIAETKTRELRSGGGGVGADVKVLKGDFTKKDENERSWILRTRQRRSSNACSLRPTRIRKRSAGSK